MTEHEGTYRSLHEIVPSAEHSAERCTAEPVWTSRETQMVRGVRDLACGTISGKTQHLLASGL